MPCSISRQAPKYSTVVWEEAAMKRGIIRSLRQGFGFIKPLEAGADVFFHASSLEQTGPKFDELGTGMKVEYEAAEGPKGLRAVQVKVLTRNH